MSEHDIIVVGASAGGVEALSGLISMLPSNLPAAVFVVLHIPAQSPSLLPDILSRQGAMPAKHPENGEKIRKGHIYIAPPDQHMLVEQGHIHLSRGPKENRHRPAIDVLFRSAALSYGTRVIGVILTGSLDDGTAGMLAIKRRGGMTIVQDPKEALYPSMPQSALTHVQIDYCLPLTEIGHRLPSLATEPAQPEEMYPVSQEMRDEVKIAEMDMSEMNSSNHPGVPSAFTCPECGGTLWEIHDGELVRFRCRVGHSFSLESMLAGQNEALEQALWVALETLEETASFTRRMMQDANSRNQHWLAKRFEERVQKAEKNAHILRDVLLKNAPISDEQAIDEALSTAPQHAFDEGTQASLNKKTPRT
ncbi:MAG TPA: chemotaxis protein CheB [Ktedonobacteraceae bacterium]|nr:chemotaxis protein CheB [Ktedonobacteraceae bacterium]